MKVAFVTELFPPFTSGGGEWSIYYLAQDLSNKGVDVVILTPNFGSKGVEYIGKVKVRRYPFYQKLTGGKTPGNFAFTNPLWILWSTICLLFFFLTEKVSIINVHQKYSIIPTYLANIFLRRPLVVTTRDYICICNYGICLFNKDKACNLREYFFSDFRYFYQTYVSKKNVIVWIVNFLFALWGRLSSQAIKFFLKRAHIVTALSYRSKSILEKNGVKNVLVIRNSFDFSEQDKSVKPQNYVLYAGRLTFGKGVGLIIDAIPKVSEELRNTKFYFAGKGEYESTIEKLGKKNSNVKLLGQLEHSSLMKIFRKAKLVLIPSIWPEPFARTNIEAVSHEIPVIVTDRGGMSEFIKDGVYGYVSKRNPEELARKIILGLKNNEKLRKNIRRNSNKIRKEFTTDVINKYLSIYRKLLI